MLIIECEATTLEKEKSEFRMELEVKRKRKEDEMKSKRRACELGKTKRLLRKF